MAAALAAGKVALEVGDLPTALRHFEDVVAGDPASPDGYGNLGALHAGLGDTERAEACYDKALAAAPGNTDVLYNRGVVRMSVEKFDGAHDDFQAVCAALPDDADARNNLAVAAFMRGHLAEARRELQRVLAGAPDHVERALEPLRRGGRRRRPAGGHRGLRRLPGPAGPRRGGPAPLRPAGRGHAPGPGRGPRPAGRRRQRRLSPGLQPPPRRRRWQPAASFLPPAPLLCDPRRRGRGMPGRPGHPPKGKDVIVYLNGQYQDGLKAGISVWDGGFLYGDGVYTTLRLYGGRPLDLAAHLRAPAPPRARRWTLRLPADAPGAGDDHRRAGRSATATRRRDGRLRITVSRGGDPERPLPLDRLDAITPTVLVTLAPLPPELPPGSATASASVCLPPGYARGNLPDLKTLNGLHHPAGPAPGRRRSAASRPS